MTADVEQHVTEVKHLGDGWRRWLASCTCGWKTAHGSLDTAHRRADEHGAQQ